MMQKRETVSIRTTGPGFSDITARICGFVSASGMKEGIVTVFIPHTSASLVIQENADPDVLKDLADAFSRLAPRDADYRHTTEGPDDMPAHIRAALTATSLSIPVANRAPLLGTWQAVYLFEHRDHAHSRDLVLHVIGE
jgi:secondary thiamine-phosphate synthase enzyme